MRPVTRNGQRLAVLTVVATLGICGPVVYLSRSLLFTATIPTRPQSHINSPANAAVPPPGTAPAPRTLISQGRPAFGEGRVIYAPSNGVSSDYGADYRCGPPCSLIVDLSQVSLPRRQTAVVTWYDAATHFYAGAIGDRYYNEPRDYTIDVNSAPAGSTPPKTGWVALATVIGNVYNAREHLLDLQGANWLRMRVTAVNGSTGNHAAAFHLDVASGPGAANDTWLFLGDSITQDDMGHYGPSNFMQQVNAAHPDRYPSQINGGIGGWTAASPLQTDPATGRRFIDEFLEAFPGHYVSLDFGTNDANGGGASTTTFAANMTQLIETVVAARKIPVLRRSIPWGCTPNIKSFGPAINAQLGKLLEQFPQAVAGPDEWAYFQSHQSLLSSDCIHPTPNGGASAYRRTYVGALLSGVYGS